MGQSYHPPSTFKGIIKGETVRILRNCTKESDYKETMDFLKEKFKQRKYPNKFVNMDIIPHHKRKEYLTYQQETHLKSKNNINLTTYFDKTRNIQEVIKNNWLKLVNDETTRRNILPKNITFSYKHSKNLSQYLVRAKVSYNIKQNIKCFEPPSIPKQNLQVKNIQCRNAQCGTCQQLSNKAGYYSYQRKT